MLPPERLLSQLCLVALLTASVTSAPQTIEGCPDLDSVNEIDVSSTSLQDLLLCFCQVIGKQTVSVSCLYGSTPSHLERAALAVSNANMSVTQLSIQHMEFPEKGIANEYFATLLPKLARLDIRECAEGSEFKVDSGAFKGLETTLENVTIHNCRLKNVPEALEVLPLLSSLVLSSNEIEKIEKRNFAGKLKLKYLDLSGNLITEIEPESFEPLGNLESLLIGEHNYINDTMLEEISRLSSLQNLDLSKSDGIFSPPEELFGHLPLLTTLKLGGCSLSSIEPGAFAPLGQLEQLDLRVNLIENISALAFDGLTNLKRLSLAGNYIRQIETDNWAGLGMLEDLDLGWNELKTIDADAFASVETTLTRLDLRHNPLKELPANLNLPELKTLILTETGLTALDEQGLKGFPKLENLELQRTNITSLAPTVFANQKDSLKHLHLIGNKLRTFAVPLSSLPALEELSLSDNPFLCDDQLATFIADVNSAYQRAATEGRAFSVPNTNETLCARPWKLKGTSVLGLKPEELEKYDESVDTTTAEPTSTTEQQTTEEETTHPIMPFTLPSLLAGEESNETAIFFKDEKERPVYDLSKTDTTHHQAPESKSSSVLITMLVLALVSLIAVVAVMLFIRKNRSSISPDHPQQQKKKPSDGMVEIELEGSSSGDRHRV